VLFPVHPRTRDRLRAAGLWDELSALPGARLVDPLPYAEMLGALSASTVSCSIPIDMMLSPLFSSGHATRSSNILSPNAKAAS